MTASIITNGTSSITLRFSYTTTPDNALRIAGAAAEELYNRGMGDHGTEEAPRLFSSYSNQDKANLLDAYFLQMVNALARDFEANKAANEARQAAISAAVQL